MHLSEFKKGSRRRWAITLLSLTTFMMIVSFQNCGSKMAFQQALNANNSAAGVTGPTICDPLSGQSQPSGQLNNGLLGTLHYLTNNQLAAPNLAQAYNNFSQLFNASQGAFNGNVFVSSINVPTRNFMSGFTDSSNNELLQDDGTLLIQYFSLKFQSNLVLGQLPAGSYQLATISDDGSILSIKSAINNNGVLSDLIINNDGNHSASMACAKTPIQLSASTQLPLELDYYQGPPTSIAVMVMYRPTPSGGGLDQECGGGQGDQYFFNTSTNPSTANQSYLNLLSRGWKPLPSTNYVLPNNAVNPCQ